MGRRRLLEACLVLEEVALKGSSKFTKYEIESSYDDLVRAAIRPFISRSNNSSRSGSSNKF